MYGHINVEIQEYIVQKLIESLFKFHFDRDNRITRRLPQMYTSNNSEKFRCFLRPFSKFFCSLWQKRLCIPLHQPDNAVAYRADRYSAQDNVGAEWLGNTGRTAFCKRAASMECTKNFNWRQKPSSSDCRSWAGKSCPPTRIRYWCVCRKESIFNRWISTKQNAGKSKITTRNWGTTCRQRWKWKVHGHMAGYDAGLHPAGRTGSADWKIIIGDRYTVDNHEERDAHIYYNFVGYQNWRITLSCFMQSELICFLCETPSAKFVPFRNTRVNEVCRWSSMFLITMWKIQSVVKSIQ